MRRKVLREGVHGKRVDWVEHHYEESLSALHVGIQFTDRTYLSLHFTPQMVTERAELLNVRNGNETVRRNFGR